MVILETKTGMGEPLSGVVISGMLAGKELGGVIDSYREKVIDGPYSAVVKIGLATLSCGRPVEFGPSTYSRFVGVEPEQFTPIELEPYQGTTGI